MLVKLKDCNWLFDKGCNSKVVVGALREAIT